MSLDKPSDKIVNVSREEVSAFVSSLYEDGRTPSDRFGISHEQLGQMEPQLLEAYREKAKQEAKSHGRR